MFAQPGGLVLFHAFSTLVPPHLLQSCSQFFLQTSSKIDFKRRNTIPLQQDHHDLDHPSLEMSPN
jgi:hypothetical protein